MYGFKVERPLPLLISVAIFDLALWGWLDILSQSIFLDAAPAISALWIMAVFFPSWRTK